MVHRYTLHIQLLKDFADFSPLFLYWLLIFTFTALKCRSYLSPTPSISQCSNNYAIKTAEKSVWLELYVPSNEQFSNASSFIRVIPFPAVFDVIRCSDNDHTYGSTQTMWSQRAPRAQGHAESASSHNSNQLYLW